ncbi:[protein-PII] uridylyltransferase [Saccharothrix tamanrassetensis]|uniref:Bifunctional uridylyltransferase/uridylyl-removing enzyme n=1 Tax=Saccharothrix tamanrassetensis TaxID=1051531 RepID=A0A841CDU5_9PSEU|nr:[protein-PII] uridylyltransferase [Saccharothrix tamanrassetensis]MBB5955529.1 [protein-PII] uridylyltransferase [Saccharothrix tamanrassetensis]
MENAGTAVVTADDLVRARDRLLAPGRRRLVGESLREALVDLHEFWLTAHALRAGVGGLGGGLASGPGSGLGSGQGGGSGSGPGSGSALVAVGGLGRRELVPYSDLDLVLVHNGHKGVEEVAGRLWYPLWNSGIGLDHSVRTVGEALRVAAGDLRTAMGLLDLRHIAGDPEISGRLAENARQAWRSGVRTRLDEMAESAQRRWARSGEIAHRVEPDLKHGRGGLRDVALLDALSVAQLTDRASAEVDEARKLLLDVRTELRRVVRRPRDVLRAQDGDEVASALGLADRFALARATSSAARTIAYAVDVAMRTARAAVPKRGLGVFARSPLRRVPARRPLDEGVVLHGSEVALARDAMPSRDPALLLRVATAAARSKHPIAAGTLSKLADSAPELRQPWPREAREELLALLGSGSGLVDVVEALDRTGLWGRLFPEWGAVRDLPPRDAAHMWTVDRHLVQATAHAARLVTWVSRPDLLLLGALLHDIGKGRQQDHSEVGAALATQVAERLGLWPQDVVTLSALVRHHLLLPHTATRRNVEDEATVRRVVDTLGGDPVLLELLHALAEADAVATGPGVWTEWKASLIRDLVARCRTAMAGDPLPEPEPLDRRQQDLVAVVSGVGAGSETGAGAGTGKPDVLVDVHGHVASVTVVAPDRPGLLSRAAGVLALNSLEVHSAVLRSHEGAAVDVFTVSPRFGSMPDVTLLREQLTRAVDGSLALTEKLAAKERDYGGPPLDPPPPRVLWFDDESTGGVVLELRAADRIGLLHRVADALERVGVDVVWARVSTLGSTVVDSFAITGVGELDGVWRERVERAVLGAAR